MVHFTRACKTLLSENNKTRLTFEKQQEKNKNIICRPWSVRIEKNCALGLEHGPRPAASGRTQDLWHSFSQYGPPGRQIIYIYFFLKHFSGPESGILEFDWLLTRVPPVQFFPIRTGFVMDHWMKVEKQHTSVELENFFIYGSKMRLFWQVTILVCVVNGKFNKEGN